MKITEQNLELICRKYCEVKGLNPDERVMHGAPISENGYQPAVALISARWEIYKERIEEFALMKALIETYLD